MIEAFILSLKAGLGNNLQFAGLRNYIRLFHDERFLAAVGNVIIYFIFQVPIMLFTALILACILNDKKLKFKGFFRTLIFLPCATSLVSSALIFKSLFALDGLVNNTTPVFNETLAYNNKSFRITVSESFYYFNYAFVIHYFFSNIIYKTIKIF